MGFSRESETSSSTQFITLATDIRKVDSVREQHTPQEIRMLSFDATPEDVTAWYFSQDPLHEVDTLLQLRAEQIGMPAISAVNQLDKTQRVLCEAGAAVLTTSVFYPQLANTHCEARMRVLARDGMKYIPEDIRTGRPMFMQYSDIASFTSFIGLHTEKKKTTFSRPELEYLRIAADLLLHAGTGIPEQSNLIIKFGNERFQWTRQTMMQNIAQYLYKEVANHGLQSPDETSQFIGLEALMMKQALLMSTITHHKAEGKVGIEPKKQVLTTLVDQFERMFVDQPDNLKGGKRGKYQGKLHELMWFVDMQMYLLASGKSFMKLFPALKAEDMPRVGYPKANRGFDFILEDKRNGKFILAQLKTNNSGNYHPLISLVNEPLIKQMSGEDIATKLAWYRRFISNNFVDDTITDHLLPSVPRIVSELETQGKKLRQTVNSLYTVNDQLETKPMSRQLRRYYERRLKKLENRRMKDYVVFDANEILQEK